MDCYLDRMRFLRPLGTALLLSLALVAVATAGPVTGQSTDPLVAVVGDASDDRPQSAQEQASQTSFDASSLFDGLGLPFLRISAPMYLQLGPHSKLREMGAGGGAGGGDSGDSGGTGIQEVFPGAGGSIGNVGVNLSDGIVTGGSGGQTTAQIPEPAMLFLLAPAIAVAVRRRMRGAHTRS
jgi:hypothetical protein